MRLPMRWQTPLLVSPHRARNMSEEEAERRRQLRSIQKLRPALKSRIGWATPLVRIHIGAPKC